MVDFIIVVRIKLRN